jgi:beta-N-acetylhexosaminidase
VVGLVIAIVLLVVSARTGEPGTATPSRIAGRAQSRHPSAGADLPGLATRSGRPSLAGVTPTHRTTAIPTSRKRAHPLQGAPAMSLAKAVGQLIIARFQRTLPTTSILAAVRSGRVGGVILFPDNTAGGVGATRALVDQLQATAHAGGNPGLLVMTDQEGGSVKRLSGPPYEGAAQMSAPRVAVAEGAATARLLKSAGVNVDLAPVADVSDVDGFMTFEHRTFGNTPAEVARAACAFAHGLSSGGVAYTLKHFPGLGDAMSSTDTGRVSVPASRSLLQADEAAYRTCGSGSHALVMVSSASYSNLTGAMPAVLSPITYREEMRADRIDAVRVSDDLEAPAMSEWVTPALYAIRAGLDLVLYAQSEAAGAHAYQQLVRGARDGQLSAGTVQVAATRVIALKKALRLS